MVTEVESVSDGVFNYLIRPENRKLLDRGLRIYQHMHKNDYVDDIPKMQAWVSQLAHCMDANTWLNRNSISSSWRFNGWGNVGWTWYAVVNAALAKVIYEQLDTERAG